MKILQLTNKVPYPPRDGGAIASLTLARELVRAGHDVTVLAMNTSKHFVSEQSTEGKPAEDIRWEIIPVDTTIRWPKALSNLLFSRLPYNAVRFISEAYRSRLIALLKAETFDCIILDNLYTGLYISDIRSNSTALLVLRAHNIEHEIWERTARSSSGWKRLYLTLLANRIRHFELSLLNQYDALVPITSRDAGHFRNFGNRKPCHVMPTGMNLAEPVISENNPSRPTVAHLGALDWLPNQNGIAWFIRQVWPIVRQELPELEFHLAGRNAPQDFEARMAAPGVVYHGEIPDAREFLAAHPIFIVPLFSGSGMRIKLLDCMAAGRATVTTTIGAEGIPIDPEREAFVADEPERFAAYIITLAKESALRESMGSCARDFIRKNFNNTFIINQFITFIRNLDTRS
jgi:glycosyltransferase involved in cell wall biosynthesis